jgi:hypothetical protein
VTHANSVEFLRTKGYANDLGKMGKIFSNEGILKTGSIGAAKIINARIRDIFNVTRKYMEKDICLLLTAESKAKYLREVERVCDSA